MNVDERMDEDEQKQEENRDVLFSFALALVLTGTLVFLGALFVGCEIAYAAALGVISAVWPILVLVYSSLVYLVLSERCSEKVSMLMTVVVGVSLIYMGGILATGTLGFIAVLVGVLIWFLWMIPFGIISYIFERV